jgi:hypothetical protein
LELTGTMTLAETSTALDEKYSRAIERLAFADSNFIFPNSNPEHASIVIETIVNFAKSRVRIFEDKLNGDLLDINDGILSSIEQKLENPSMQVEIVVRHRCDQRPRDMELIESLRQRYNDRFNIRLANSKFVEEIKKVFSDDIFFAVGDTKSFRLEKADGGPRKAICCFNHDSIPARLAKAFDASFKSQTIELF